MAQAQLIQGTGAELLAHLEQYRHRKNLLLIIPEEQTPEGSADSAAGVGGSIPGGGTQNKAVVRNGVPLLPTQGATQKVTMELVKRLAEEE